jgi:hypothetical protein
MTRVFLALAAISVLWVSTTGTQAQPRRQKAEKAIHVPAGWPREVTGYGQTKDEARKDAVKQAAESVTAFLQRQDPPLDAWQPDEEYVRTHLLEGEGREGDQLRVADGVVRATWIQPLKRTPDWNAMVQLNQSAQRHHLAVERQTTAGIGLAALTALLATGWGYLRVDEWTRGRFSKWLRIGAVTLIALTGAAWLVSNL